MYQSQVMLYTHVFTACLDGYMTSSNIREICDTVEILFGSEILTNCFIYDVCA